MPATPVIDAHFSAQLVDISRAAGVAILAIYDSAVALDIEFKSDESPLTAADIAAHNLIVRELKNLHPVPIISEESVVPSLEERKRWPMYWLVDPLDGTKEFIARNGQFTVNIALVMNGVPLAGVVHVPVSDETYLGIDKSLMANGVQCAEKFVGAKKVADLRTRSLTERLNAKDSMELLISHRHGSEAVAELVKKLEARWPAPLTRLNIGSSLKFCMIAEGKADFYPRLAPTCEWDTAAAQAVLTAAGGLVVNALSLDKLTCNNTETLLNPFFFALGDADFDWRALLID
ncbi:MAG: 3'(2'),5'-bisphosphate nucleotidase [Moraxellaceae bacterium]|nr:MAG: 3'(2'),5'-bisphosphate nucleotidase [Moraxellaceae bacterium]